MHLKASMKGEAVLGVVSPRSHGPRDALPLLRHMRSQGRDKGAFRGHGQRPWVLIGVALLMMTAFLPVLWPQGSVLTERLAPLLGLVFLIAAGGLWLGMGGRAVWIGAAVVLGLYGLTAWTRIAFSVHDLYVVNLLVGFFVYALAGFYVIFVLEEAVYDAHRLLHLAHPAWALMPTALVAALTVGLPLSGRIGWEFPRLWMVSLVAVALLGGWWVMRAFTRLRSRAVIRELHLFVAAALAAALVMDLLPHLDELGGFATSALAYGILVGTWMYASYTTLQRTHFLLGGRNAEPWLAILLGASFAILGHAQLLYDVGNVSALLPLLDLRLLYLVIGLWIGLAFFIGRSFWRLSRYLRDDRSVAPRGRIVAGRLSRIGELLIATEERMGDVAIRAYRGLDEVLPGSHREPQRPHPFHGWELDGAHGAVRPLLAEEMPNGTSGGAQPDEEE
jgi:hypothetical protein